MSSTRVKAPDVMNRAAVTFDLNPLDPGSYGIVTSCLGQERELLFRVIAARAIADFPQSWLSRLVRRIPGVQWLLRDRDADRRARATAQMQIDHVAVGNFARLPDKCDELPIVTAGSPISVRVSNVGDRPIVVRVLVEGVLS